MTYSRLQIFRVNIIIVKFVIYISYFIKFSIILFYIDFLNIYGKIKKLSINEYLKVLNIYLIYYE